MASQLTETLYSRQWWITSRRWQHWWASPATPQLRVIQLIPTIFVAPFTVGKQGGAGFFVLFFKSLMILDSSLLTFTDISLMLRSCIKQTIFAPYKYITDVHFDTVHHIQRHRNVVLRHHSGVQNFCTIIYLKANTCTNEVSAKHHQLKQRTYDIQLRKQKC